jgi:CRP/FNR family transcriptional regulator, dissimilatory nitrate respiration regulator
MLDELDKTLIGSLPLFEGLPNDVLDGLLDQAVPRDYPKGHILFHRDDPAECFYIVLDGWVKVYRETVNGDEAVLGVFTSGETLAEAAAFLDQGYPASGQVVEDARVVPVFSGAIRREIINKPGIAMNMLASMSKRMHHLVVEVEQLKTCSATQRVIEFLLRRCALEEGSAVIFLPYDKTLISRRLGMQPESLSRILSKLRKLGVRTEQNRVVISNVEILLDYCQAERSNGQMVSNG